MNIVANFVSAAYDISNVNPKRISFRKGGIITSILALVSMPWNLYNSPEVIAYFLGGLGALLGPFFGILATGLLLVSQGPLQYSGPVPADAGVEVLLPQRRQPAGRHCVRAVRRDRTVLALVPMFGKVAPFGWFIGAALGAIAYYIVTRGKPLVDGPVEETVARPEQQPVD